MIKGFTILETKGDMTLLLKEIRSIGLQIKTNTSLYDALDKANALYYSYKQEDGGSNAKHLRKFKSIVSAVEHLGGLMFADDALINLAKDSDVKKEKITKKDEDYKSIVRDKTLGVGLLKRANQHKYGKLMTSIRDQHSFKKDVYSKSITEAYGILENHSSAKTGDTKNPPWKRDGGGRYGGGRGGRGGRGHVRGIQFSQQAEIISGSDGRTISHIKCFKRDKRGHYSDCCPNEEEGEQIHVDAFEIITSDYEDLERDDEDKEEVTTLQEEDYKYYDKASRGESEAEDGGVVNEGVREEGINRYAWENEAWSSDSEDSLVILLQFNQHENGR